jgi:hypothetical protein
VQKPDGEILEIPEARERDGRRAFDSAALARGRSEDGAPACAGPGIWAGHVIDGTERPTGIGGRPR